MAQKWLPKITVVTVVYNGASEIENTINSVLRQDYTNIEYIVVDGGSSDGTLEIIKSYDGKITCWVSEPDKGIYDAMNKGIRLASGDVINFMNAGDLFASTAILSRIASLLKQDMQQIIYGDDEVLYPDGRIKIRRASRSINELPKKMPCCHQSLFVPLSSAKSRPFDLSFSLAADFFQLLSIISLGVGVRSIEFTISRVSSGGVSDKSRKSVWLEYERAYAAFSGNPNRIYYWFNSFLLDVKVRIKQVIKYVR